MSVSTDPPILQTTFSMLHVILMYSRNVIPSTILNNANYHVTNVPAISAENNKRTHIPSGGHGRDRMVVGFTSTYAISACHQ